jgi:UDP-N-acetylmuramoyl-tripeptide--D-alanyl-D-alanine ligase
MMLPGILYPLFLKSRSVSIDSRNVKKGDIFFALKGEQTNGNQFAIQAIQRGAEAAVVDDLSLKNTPGCIYVDDTLVTLQNLATFHRSQIDIPVIGLTGSNGKTTTKKLIYHLLSARFKAYCTPGNYNNHIGVPLTVLGIPEDAEIAVIEMGANHQGEIAFLSKIAQPTHGLITNIGKAHLEGFGGIEGVKTGKGELYDYLALHHGVVFYNKEEQFLPDMAQKIAKRVAYSTKGPFLKMDEGIQIEVHQWEPHIIFDLIFSDTQQRIPFEVSLMGSYNFANVAASMAVAAFFEVPWKVIQKELQTFQPETNRSEQVIWRGNTVLLDAYNANPNSMKAAITTFAKMKGRQQQIMVLGEMYELGDYAEVEHREIGAMCEQFPEIKVILVGKGFQQYAQEHGLMWYTDSDALRAKWELDPPSDCHLLLKGSRGVALEKTLF